MHGSYRTCMDGRLIGNLGDTFLAPLSAMMMMAVLLFVNTQKVVGYLFRGRIGEGACSVLDLENYSQSSNCFHMI